MLDFWPWRWPDIDYLFCIRCARRRTHIAGSSYECRTCGTRRSL